MSVLQSHWRTILTTIQDSISSVAHRLTPPESTRGIVWTIEILLTVLLLLAAVVALIQVTGVTQDQQQVTAQEEQLQQLATDVTTHMESNETARRAVLYYNTTADSFIQTESDAAGVNHYTTLDGDPDHPLHDLFQTLNNRPVNYQLTLVYTNQTTGSTERFPLVYQGVPQETSVTTSSQLILREGDVPAATAQNCTLEQLANNTTCSGESYLIPQTTTTTDRYNVVTLRLTLWQS